jgi:drug/metabolite transporter (DMT)-like permease
MMRERAISLAEEATGVEEKTSPSVDISRAAHGLRGAPTSIRCGGAPEAGDRRQRSVLTRSRQARRGPECLDRMNTSLGFTLSGVASILIWSTTVAVSRLVMERLGVFPGTSAILLLSGLLLVGLATLRERGLGWARRISRPHALRAAPLFVLYMVCLNGAIGLAETRLQAIVAGLANYIWPTMILVFSIVLLKRRPRPAPLAAGVVLVLAGIVAATSVTAGGLGSLGAARAPVLPVLLGLVAGLAWGLYSVIGRAYPQEAPTGALGLFLLAAGLVAAALGAGSWRTFNPTEPAIAMGIYMVLFPTSLAYWLWSRAMQRGDVATLGVLSNLIPVLSAGLAVAVLGVPWRWELVVGAVLVSAGAGVSRLAFRGDRPDGSEEAAASHGGRDADPA